MKRHVGSVLRNVFLITTAYVSELGPYLESTWGIALSKEAAEEELRKSFPFMKPVGDGSYLTTSRIANKEDVSILIRVSEQPMFC